MNNTKVKGLTHTATAAAVNSLHGVYKMRIPDTHAHLTTHTCVCACAKVDLKGLASRRKSEEEQQATCGGSSIVCRGSGIKHGDKTENIDSAKSAAAAKKPRWKSSSSLTLGVKHLFTS